MHKNENILSSFQLPLLIGVLNIQVMMDIVLHNIHMVTKISGSYDMGFLFVEVTSKILLKKHHFGKYSKNWEKWCIYNLLYYKTAICVKRARLQIRYFSYYESFTNWIFNKWKETGNIFLYFRISLIIICL